MLIPHLPVFIWEPVATFWWCFYGLSASNNVRIVTVLCHFGGFRSALCAPRTIRSESPDPSPGCTHRPQRQPPQSPGHRTNNTIMTMTLYSMLELLSLPSLTTLIIAQLLSHESYININLILPLSSWL